MGRFYRCRRGKIHGFLGIYGLGFFLISSLAYAPSQPVGLAEKGESLFREKCVACHTIGGGNLVGPDLKGVTTRRQKDWLKRWVLAPEQLLAQKDPIAAELLKTFNDVPMPNLGLSEEEVEALLSYLEKSEEAEHEVSASPLPSEILPAGDALVGKSIFAGVRRLKNGGPPCMACHSVAGIGALGGGALGPDLTQAYTKYGDAGLASVLATTPFPTMTPIFSQKPLTPEEQSHLKAFLQQAVAERPAKAMIPLATLSVLGAFLFLSLAQFLWRNRLVEVRKPIMKRR